MSTKALKMTQSLYTAVAGGTEDSVEERGLGAILEALRENFQTLVIEPGEMIDAGAGVVVPVRVGGLGKSGAEAWVEVFHVHTIVDDRPVGVEVFYDRASALRAAGLESLAVSQDVGSGAEMGGDLDSGGDAELAKDAPKVGLDGLMGDE